MNSWTYILLTCTKSTKN